MGSFISQSASAQATSSSAPATDENAPHVLEKYEVTGSYIPYSADAPAVPVTLLSIPDIQATGEGDLLEVLRKAVPQFVGNSNIGSSNSSIQGGSTNGGSRIQLRNVATLVLINGRRGVFAPVSAVGGFDFVDVNSIPVSAVQSIEVLKDGASALYGSDAVSGVVNIILRKDFEGVEIGGRYRVSETMLGTWEERSARIIAGASSGKTSLTVSFEWL
ncbi:MAG: TonB-dependent receptor plug domain-containing protein, partial [Opitutus sp.]